MTMDRSDYIRSLEQLLTTSCILAGFSISGLIALPGIEDTVYSKIVSYFEGDFNFAFYVCFYALFFSTLSFLGTIMIVLVYRINNYFVPMKKLRFMHFVANMVFNFAIATLMVAVITFGIPTMSGIIASAVIGLGMAGCFIWENMVPWQRKRREEQIKKENEHPE